MKKTCVLNLRISPESMEGLKTVARVHNTTVSDLVRQFADRPDKILLLIEAAQERREKFKATIARWTEKNIPDSLSSSDLRLVAEALLYVADKMKEQGR